MIHTVDPEQRAFGAGNSAFNGQWVITNPSVGGSVNNFALHLSLETPIDGEDDAPGHSGYSAAQYDALAVVLTDWMRRSPSPPATSPPIATWTRGASAPIPAASTGVSSRCGWRPWGCFAPHPTRPARNQISGLSCSRRLP